MRIVYGTKARLAKRTVVRGSARVFDMDRAGWMDSLQRGARPDGRYEIATSLRAVFFY